MDRSQAHARDGLDGGGIVEEVADEVIQPRELRNEKDCTGRGVQRDGAQVPAAGKPHQPDDGMDLQHRGQGQCRRPHPPEEGSDGQQVDHQRLGVAIQQLLAPGTDQERRHQEAAHTRGAVPQPDRGGGGHRQEAEPQRGPAKHRDEHCQQRRVSVLVVLADVRLAGVRVLARPE